MARFQRVLPMVDFQEKSFAKVHNFLIGKKFKYETVDGQQVFRKGDGFWAAAKFIRVCYADNHVLLEAWVDAQGAEMDLNGPIASAAKKPLEKVVVQVQEILTQPGAGYVPAESTGAFPVFPDDRPVLPAGITKREYIKNYAGDHFRRQLRNTAIVGYICAGLNLIVALALNAYALIDVAIILGLTLGMHLGKSKGCAVGMLIYGIYAVVSSLIFNGSFGGWLLLVLGIMAVQVFDKAEKHFKQLTANQVQKKYSSTYGK